MCKRLTPPTYFLDNTMEPTVFSLCTRLSKDLNDPFRFGPNLDPEMT